MKSFFYPAFFFLFLLATSSIYSQNVNFEDGFEDGNFTDNPPWTGDSDNFSINNDRINPLLQLTASGSGTSYLSTQSSNTAGLWEFYVCFDRFEPSESNRAEIFLMSNIADLKGPVSGYAVQIGETGADVARIVRYDNGTEAKTILSDTTTISETGGGYRFKVHRDSAGRWQLEVGKGYSGRLINSGMNQTDSTYSNTSYFGVRVDYTSSRAEKFFFDFKIDLPPFDISEAVPKDGRVEIKFNRDYNPSTVQKEDFEINNGIGIPLSIDMASPSVVLLDYGDITFKSDRYQVTAREIKDLNGKNLVANTTKEFIVFGLYSPGDIVINEFMYDPPKGQSEYIELNNTSNKILNLADWELGDNEQTDPISTREVVLEADSFLVISADTAALFSTYGLRPYVCMTSLANFNNSGDTILLNTDTGRNADSLTYHPGWGGNKVSLERRDPKAPSVFPENFLDSPNKLGGTPGGSNEVPTDRIPPRLQQLTAPDSHYFQLVFSESLDPVSTTEFKHYSISPHRKIQEVIVRRDTVTLFVNSPLISGTTYEVTVHNLKDIFGNSLDTITERVEFLKFSTARPGDIRINEILYSPAAGGAEFVELNNISQKNLDLSSWEIGDAGNLASLESGTIIKAGGYLVLTGNRSLSDTLKKAQLVEGFPSLNDRGDLIYIQTDRTITIDSLSYSEDWGGRYPGTSLERKDPLRASNDRDNFGTSTASIGSTPGRKNSIFEEDIKPPSILFSKILPDGNISVQFSEFINLTEALSFSSDGNSMKIIHFNRYRGNIVKLASPSAPLTKVTIQNLEDVRGNITASARIPVARKIKPGAVAINEIMFNPLGNPDDNLPDQSEYIELRNTQDHAISLEGIFIHDEPDEDGDIRPIHPVTTRAKWLPAEGTAIYYADESSIFSKSNIAKFFHLDSLNLSFTLRADRSSLSLASTDDAVYLSDSTGTTVDSVFFDESWHNPNLLETMGISLERINPKSAGNYAPNWSSSTVIEGGTPASENSIFQEAVKSATEIGLQFDPNPFSPDNDGFEDHLLIQYTLDEPDYFMTVHIYDRFGRLIRELADSKPAGIKGSLIWDGRKDDGSKNRIGIYIVIFKAYNSNSGKDIAFKGSVVIARRLH